MYFSVGTAIRLKHNYYFITLNFCKMSHCVYQCYLNCRVPIHIVQHFSFHETYLILIVLKKKCSSMDH